MIPFLLISLRVILGTSVPADPIDRVIKTSCSEPLWENGAFPSLDLPAAAPTEQVVEKAFKMTNWPGKGPACKIIEKRQVHIRGPLPDLYTAVLIKTGKEEDIVLLQFAGAWWSRIYHVPV